MSEKKKYVPPNRRNKSEDEKLKERKARFEKPKQEEYGYVSRGEENKLQKDESARRSYFDKIKKMDREKPDLILDSLRKLREAMLQHKPDEFTKSVYMFSFEFSSSIGRYQAYVPCGQFLLREKHLLTKDEIKQIAQVIILHISHCNNDSGRAWLLFFRHFTRQDPLYAVLESWDLEDYYKWIQFFEREKDPARKNVMKLGLPKMMRHMAACLTILYFTMAVNDMAHLMVDGDVEQFIDKYNTGWTIEGSTVTLRRRK